MWKIRLISFAKYLHLLTDKLCGKPLKCKPDEISRCGMSIAQYAQHRESHQWFELSSDGNIIGSPLQLDFYRQTKESGQLEQSKDTQKVLVEA